MAKNLTTEERRFVFTSRSRHTEYAWSFIESPFFATGDDVAFVLLFITGIPANGLLANEAVDEVQATLNKWDTNDSGCVTTSYLRLSTMELFVRLKNHGLYMPFNEPERFYDLFSIVDIPENRDMEWFANPLPF